MSIGNVVAMLGAGMSGFMKGRQQQADAEAAAEDRKFRQWQRGQMQAQAARDDALRGDLSAAGAPVQMTQSGGKPDTMDNADVGQPGEQAVQPFSYGVGDQQFADQGQAQQAAAAANTPQAQAQRFADVYAKAGQPTMAMAVKKEAMQSELAQLGLDEKHAQVAGQLFDKGLEPLATHEDIADYLTKSRAGMAMKAVPSANGKTVTYNKVNEDGTLTPTTHTYTNDADGADKAKLWLSQNTPLAAKIAAAHQTFEEGLAAKKETSEGAERAARSRYYDAMGAAAGIKAEKVGTGKAPLYDRMDESDKLELQNAYKASTEVDGLINKGMADGSLTKDSDNYKFLTAKKVAADLKARAVLARYADSPAPGGAADPLGLRGDGGAAAPAPSPAPAPAPSVRAMSPAEQARIMDIAKRGGFIARPQPTMAPAPAAPVAPPPVSPAVPRALMTSLGALSPEDRARLLAAAGGQ